MSDLHTSYQKYLEIQEQIKQLQEEAKVLMQEGRNKAITDIKALLAVYEIRADEVGFAVPPSPPKRERKPEKRRDRTPKGEPKYRDPDSGATWTGSGRTPKWLEGKNHEDFLILIDKPAPAPTYSPTPSPAVDASHAVHSMASATMPQPAAAWPTGAPNFGQDR
jgi:DNA-binding protein H-NS